MEAPTGLSDQKEPLLYAIAMRLCVSQRLWVVNKGAVTRALIGDTWQRSSVLCYGRQALADGGLNSEVNDWIDGFLNDWLASHGK